METNTQQINVQRFYPLGSKTLVALIIKRCFFIVILVVVLFVGLYILQYVPREYISVALYAFLGYLMVASILSLIGFFLGWLEYTRYEIEISDKSLKMQRGIIAVEQVGIPYRYIQDIKIERSLVDQIIGVSEVIVTIAGSEQQEIHPGETPGGNVHKIVLPAIDKKIARQIQEIVLGRAQIQQMDISDRRAM